MKRILILSLLLLVSASSAVADTEEFTIEIENHKFSPAELEVPANKKVKLTVVNKDGTPEEFESHDLNREKVVPGGSKVVVFIGPLVPGEYKFFGEFHEDSAQGKIIVR